MARTTSAAVGLIIEVDAAISLTSFIEVANMMVTDICVDSGYTAANLEMIERFLTAHFYTLRDPRTTSEKAGSVSARYQSHVDLGFDTSHYGQTAMRLATAGELAALNEKAKKGGGKTVGITWVGDAETNTLDD